jgi:hypothetical protein
MKDRLLGFRTISRNVVHCCHGSSWKKQGCEFEALNMQSLDLNKSTGLHNSLSVRNEGKEDI